MTPRVRPEIILASASPRRKELLASLGLAFRTLAPRIRETPRPGEKPRLFALRMAREKARWASRHLPVRRGHRAGRPLIIAADTIVTLAGEILGKPRGRRDAIRMLRALAGRPHQVVTGLCLRTRRPDGSWAETSRTVFTRVEFKDLHHAEIAAYVRTGEPMDKAGAYAIQGKAAGMIRSLRGSYTNVVGLPLAELCDLLAGDFAGPTPARSHPR